jgi:hypothetical protein
MFQLVQPLRAGRDRCGGREETGSDEAWRRAPLTGKRERINMVVRLCATEKPRLSALRGKVRETGAEEVLHSGEGPRASDFRYSGRWIGVSGQDAARGGRRHVVRTSRIAPRDGGSKVVGGAAEP